MSRIVTEAEAAFLAMLAKRTLRFQREAEVRGEKYHDLTKPYPLSCGHWAKLSFQPAAHGYEPLVTIKLKHGANLAIAEQMARDIVGGPVVSCPSAESDVHQFVRKI